MVEDYPHRKERTAFDCVGIATALTAEVLKESIRPQVQAAFRFQFPSVDPGGLSWYSHDQLQGFVNGLIRNYFELLDPTRTQVTARDNHLSGVTHAGSLSIFTKSAGMPFLRSCGAKWSVGESLRP